MAESRSPFGPSRLVCVLHFVHFHEHTVLLSSLGCLVCRTITAGCASEYASRRKPKKRNYRLAGDGVHLAR